jgi:hypothetical protein
MLTVEQLLGKTGQIVTIKTQRTMKVRKGRAPIDKESTFQARCGVAYDNIKAVKEKREDGRLPEENQGLPWGTWKKFPYIIEHKGEEYFRFSTIKTAFVPKVRYLRDGQEINAETAREDCLASEFSPKDELDVFNIKISSILEVKG